jgi:hypothetical protein
MQSNYRVSSCLPSVVHELPCHDTTSFSLRQTTLIAITHFSLHITLLTSPHYRKDPPSISQQTNHITIMEAIKNAIGLGSTPTTTEQQGREPVNGVTGSGVGGEPYDQGNAEGMHCH